jgi:hypothetical protein
MREHAEQRGFRDGRSKLACVCRFVKPMQILSGPHSFLGALRLSRHSFNGGGCLCGEFILSIQFILSKSKMILKANSRLLVSQRSGGSIPQGGMERNCERQPGKQKSPFSVFKDAGSQWL